MLGTLGREPREARAPASWAREQPRRVWEPGARGGGLGGASRVEGASRVVRSLRLTSPVPVPSGVPGCCGPGRFSALRTVSAARACGWRCRADRVWKGLGGGRPPFPCPISGVDLPLAIVSKDHGMSVTCSRTNANLPSPRRVRGSTRCCRRLWPVRAALSAVRGGRVCGLFIGSALLLPLLDTPFPPT